MSLQFSPRVFSVLWPAFMVAAAAELVFFGLVDPLDLRIFDGLLGDSDRTSVYSLSFLFFWAVGVITAMLSELLHKRASEINHVLPPVRRDLSYRGRGVAHRQHALHH